MAVTWPTKDPDELWELYFNWLPQLSVDNDTIASSVWEPDPGLTLSLDSFTDNETVVWLSGGTNGYLYTVKNTITTVGGRTWVARLKVRCREKYCLVDS